MAKKSLSDLAVKRIKPPASGQVDTFDLGYPGFALRTSYGGSKSWVFFYRLGERQRRLTLGHYPSTSLGDARDLWRQAREQVALGRDPRTTTYDWRQLRKRGARVAEAGSIAKPFVH